MGPTASRGCARPARSPRRSSTRWRDKVVPGMTTGEIDDIVRSMTLDAGAVPATLGYRGYTKSCCTSINHVVCHGIPGDKALKDGDIVNIDVTPLLDGWHGDTSRMFLVGDVSIKARKLVDVTYECLMLGLEQAQARQPPRRHQPRHPGPRRKASLRHRPRFLRPRPRPAVPRQPRSGPRRPPRHRPRASPRHVLHRRADDQHRPRRRANCSTTAGPR